MIDSFYIRDHLLRLFITFHPCEGMDNGDYLYEDCTMLIADDVTQGIPTEVAIRHHINMEFGPDVVNQERLANVIGSAKEIMAFQQDRL